MGIGSIRGLLVSVVVSGVSDGCQGCRGCQGCIGGWQGV